MMDERQFTRMLLESEQMLYRIACTFLRSEADRQDAMQETAMKAWKNWAGLREERYFRTWISRIMVNECHNLYRNYSRCVPTDTMPDRSAPENGDEEMRMLLEGLPEKQRVPLVLHYLEGFSLEEIAKIQHVTLPLVKYRMRQARKALRVEWNGKEESK